MQQPTLAIRGKKDHGHMAFLSRTYRHKQPTTKRPENSQQDDPKGDRAAIDPTERETVPFVIQASKR